MNGEMVMLFFHESHSDGFDGVIRMSEKFLNWPIYSQTMKESGMLQSNKIEKKIDSYETAWSSFLNYHGTRSDGFPKILPTVKFRLSYLIVRHTDLRRPSYFVTFFLAIKTLMAIVDVGMVFQSIKRHQKRADPIITLSIQDNKKSHG